MPTPSIELFHHVASVTLLGSVLFASHRMYRGQRWRIAEFVSAEMRRFESVREVRNALAILDHSSREIDFGGDVAGQRWGRVDRSTLIAALSPPKGRGGLGFPLWRIRDTFSVFFTELGRFEVAIRAGLFSSRELEPHLGKRLGILAGSLDRTTREAICGFLHRGGFDEVIALLRRFGHEIHLPGQKVQIADQMLPPKLVPRDSLVAARLLPRWDQRR